MTAGDLTPSSDPELLRVSEDVLQEAGFATRRARFGGFHCVLAENPWFILAVASVVSLDDLKRVDDAVALEVANEVADADVREKQWDVYLVLLTSAVTAADDTDLLYRIAYDTHYLRRVVRTGVAASGEPVRKALRAFMPLPEIRPREVVEDPLTLLEAALVTRGIDEDFAGRAIAEFRAQGGISGA